MARFFDPEWDPTKGPWADLLSELGEDVRRHEVELQAKYGPKLNQARELIRKQAKEILSGQKTLGGLMGSFLDPNWEPTDEQWAEVFRGVGEDVRRQEEELRAKYGQKLDEAREKARQQAEAAMRVNEAHRSIATIRAAKVLEMLETQGVKARLVGELANPGKFSKWGFGPGSEVEFLFEICPRELKYLVEADVEEILQEIPFKVMYLDEMRPDLLTKFGYGSSE